MSQESQKLVRHALQIGALELIPEGRKLNSGRISPYFFNSALFRTGHDLNMLADAYIATIEKHRELLERTDVLFGPAYKGIPLAAVISARTADLSWKNYGWAFNRKEEKDHGEGGRIGGHPLRGKNILVTEDTITKGTTLDKTTVIINEEGGRLVGVVLAFDRNEYGQTNGQSALQECIRKYNVPIFASATVGDLVDVLTEDPNIHPDGADVLPKIQGYIATYGA